MSRLPRDVNGSELMKALERLGYSRVRQSGSHVRLRTMQNGRHHVTVPAHSPVKAGTLQTILNMVAAHFEITRDELLDLLFG